RGFSMRPELHCENPCHSAIPELATGELRESLYDAHVLLRVPAIIQAVARSGPQRWVVEPHDSLWDTARFTYLARGQVMADARQYYRFSISIFGGSYLSAGIFGQNTERDPASGAETANLFEVHVIHLLEQSCPRVSRELRE